MKLTLLLLLAHIASSNSGDSISLPSIFSDEMVLQQRTQAPFWGSAKPGRDVIIKGSWGASARAVATKDGSWFTKLRTPSAGGPYKVTVQSGDTMVMFNDVLIGEVWLCSGQSNMEMPLEGFPPSGPIKNSAEEIRNAHNPRMRYFLLNRAVAVSPEPNCQGEWKICDSATASKFSATAHFFGKTLSEKLKVPIGLIQSSWGGTPIQAWTSDRFLRESGQFDSTLNTIDTNRADIIHQTSWMRSNLIVDVSKRESSKKWQDLNFNDQQCPESGYDDRNWRTMNLPTLWENAELGEFDGAVWYRRTIVIPRRWTHNDLVLSLGPIDDVDRTYVNGELVGKTEEEEQWQKDRVYAVPKELVHDSVLTIAVRVIDYGGGGGIYGDKAKMNLHAARDTVEISLAGGWKYLPVAEYLYSKFYVYGAPHEKFYSRPKTSFSITPSTPTGLYNAMISPIVPYAIRGAIWYQGESNTNHPRMYREQLPLMIRNWRDDWNEGEFSFYFVQIAPYNYDDTVQSQVLRESQLVSLSIPHTGMAVTLDIGEPKNIHPADKRSVGERLARWALAKDYNKKIPFSGPLYRSIKIAGDSIIVSFDYADKGLMLKDDGPNSEFLIAGDDRIFVKAEVRVDGKQLILHGANVRSPVAVRYAWSNTAKATLFNMEGLPASSFRSDAWGN